MYPPRKNRCKHPCVGQWGASTHDQVRLVQEAQASRKWILLRPRAKLVMLFHKLWNQPWIRESLLKI